MPSIRFFRLALEAPNYDSSGKEIDNILFAVVQLK